MQLKDIEGGAWSSQYRDTVIINVFQETKVILEGIFENSSASQLPGKGINMWMVSLEHFFLGWKSTVGILIQSRLPKATHIQPASLETSANYSALPYFKMLSLNKLQLREVVRQCWAPEVSQYKYHLQLTESFFYMGICPKLEILVNGIPQMFLKFILLGVMHWGGLFLVYIAYYGLTQEDWGNWSNHSGLHYWMLHKDERMLCIESYCLCYYHQGRYLRE